MSPPGRIAAATLGVLALCTATYVVGRMHGTSSAAPAHAVPTPAPDRTSARLAKPGASVAASRDADPPQPVIPGRHPGPTAASPTSTPGPLHVSETIDATADAFPDLLAAWDAGVAEDLFGDADLEALAEKLAWMHDRVGRCGSPAPMTSGSASSGRFSYVCERGVIEAGFMVSDPDENNIAKMRAGVRDMEPPPEVSAAAKGVTELIESWDDTAFEERFADGFREKLGASMPNFTKDLREELGACSVGPVDLASQHGALFVLDCEQGRRTMVVSLDEANQIRALRVVPLRRDPAVEE